MSVMLTALIRAVPPTIAECELTHQERQPINAALAAAQHGAYEEALRDAGCKVIHVEPAPAMPDSVFIEDTAIVLDELAIITRPGAESRRGETAAVADCLRSLRPLALIEDPATIDGGDVLRIGKRIFIGLSTRTNVQAVDQVRRIVAPLGYTVDVVEVPGALHLKSAMTAIDGQTLIANRAALADLAPFREFHILEVPSGEPEGANVLRVADRLLVPASAVATVALLRERAAAVVPVEQSELAKAEAGLTCCSLILDNP